MGGKKMLEIRFHGRGGQGTVVATILLSKAFFQAGWEVQSFPFFGVERRGAPVEAYLRLDKKKILVRTNVTAPDHVVVQDQTLIQNIDVTRGMKPGGWVLLNSPALPENLDPYRGMKLACVDATRIALRHFLGSRTHPIVNTAMIGAFARMLSMPPLEAACGAIQEEAPSDPEANIAAARDAYNEVILHGSIS